MANRYPDMWVEQPGIYLEEQYVNETEHCRTGDPYRYSIGHLDNRFLDLQRLYGRCISKMYLERGGATLHVGWVFEKHQKYSDCNETYLQHVWVSTVVKLKSERTKLESWRTISLDEARAKLQENE